jgi:hypothetical protein
MSDLNHASGGRLTASSSFFARERARVERNSIQGGPLGQERPRGNCHNAATIPFGVAAAHIHVDFEVMPGILRAACATNSTRA